MLEKIKNSSLMTKLLYLFALTIFVAWVLPKINSYYINVNSYQKGIHQLENISSKYGLVTKTKKFSTTTFKQDTKLLFSQVAIKNLNEKTYEVHITIKREDLERFHTFLETISLRYYVEIIDDLEFKSEAEIINIKIVLRAF